MRLLLVCLLITPAFAERYVVKRGETLGAVAKKYGCTTAQVERANRVDNSLVPAGTVVTVPDCRPRPEPVVVDDDRAKRALAVIDGVKMIPATNDVPADPDRMDGFTWIGHVALLASLPAVPDHHRAGAQALGAPWAGSLDHAAKLQAGEGYFIKRPARSYGTQRLIDYTRSAIAEVRALYPDVHTLAVGDISAELGGKISDHRSHQSGLDVDIGFYFKSGATQRFDDANADLDLEATWALLTAFTRIAAQDDGVQMIFLDYDVQRRLYDCAKKRGTRDEELAFMFQYPNGPSELTGLVRHWPGHQNHMHVRFKP
ncbi:MAG: penicillin-insensitive murein endopeptidase [Kofleriaceae bacterium]